MNSSCPKKCQQINALRRTPPALRISDFGRPLKLCPFFLHTTGLSSVMADHQTVVGGSDTSSTTRTATTPTEINNQKNNNFSELPPPVSSKANHPGYDFFDTSGTAELSQRLSRTQTNPSQDPTNPTGTFNYEVYLKNLLRKTQENSIQSRTLGVTFEGLEVQGSGSGIAYGSTVGSLLTGALRIGETIRSLRRPVRKIILKDLSGGVRPGEMLLVLGR